MLLYVYMFLVSNVILGAFMCNLLCLKVRCAPRVRVPSNLSQCKHVMNIEDAHEKFTKYEINV